MAMAAPSFALSAVTSDGTAEPFEGRESKEGVAAEDYQCAVCLGLPLAPVVAMCGHDFCRSCYDGCRRKSAQCPLCRQRFSTRMPGVCHRLEAALGQLFPRQIAQRRQAAAAEAADLAAATDRAVASGRQVQSAEQASQQGEIEAAAASLAAAGAAATDSVVFRCLRRLLTGRGPLTVVAISAATISALSAGVACGCLAAMAILAARSLVCWCTQRLTAAGTATAHCWVSLVWGSNESAPEVV